jgi:hypothetical protein
VEFLSRQPAYQRDRIDADVIQLALGLNQLVPLRRILLLARRAELRRPDLPLGEEDVRMDRL